MCMANMGTTTDGQPMRRRPRIAAKPSRPARPSRPQVDRAGTGAGVMSFTATLSSAGPQPVLSWLAKARVVVVPVAVKV